MKTKDRQVRLEKFLQKSEKGELRKKFFEDVTLKGKGLSHICLFFQRKRIRNGNNNKTTMYICIHMFKGIIGENLIDKKERVYVQVKRPHCLLVKKNKNKK